MYKEIWVDIKGYEDCYQVSNLGNVRSKTRITSGKNKWNSFDRTIKGKNLKLNRSKANYRMIELYKDGNYIKRSVHRLVYINFIGDIEDGNVIHHIDGDEANNKLNNLQSMDYITHNNFHSHEPWNKGIAMPAHIVSKCTLSRTKTMFEKAVKMSKMRKSGMSARDIAKVFDCTERTVHTTLSKKEYYREYIRRSDEGN